MKNTLFINSNKIISLTILFFIFFPYISITNHFNTSDTQPYAFISSIIFIISIFIFFYLNKYKIYFHYFLLFIVFAAVYSICISIIKDSFDFRNIFGYISIALFAFTGYLFAKFNLVHKYFLYFTILIYFIFGLIQKFYNRRFGEYLLSNFRAADGFRGANSLTTEPSFYSNQMIFLFIIVCFIVTDTSSKKQVLIKNIMLSIIIFQIIFLSQAITGVIWVIILLAIITIIHKKFITLFIVFLTVPLGMFISSYNTNASRLNSFFYALNNTPQLIISRDESVNQRIADIVVSIYSFISELPLSFGRGTHSWNDFMNENYINFKFILFPSLSSNKIMSGYGTILFETGIIGLIAIIIPYFYFTLKIRTPINLSISIFFPLFMLSAVQISNPLFGFILGYIIFISSYKESIR